MARESVAGCGDALARQITLFGKPSDDAELLAAIDDVTGERVGELAARLIAAAPPALAAVGPSFEIMSNEALAARLAA
jgi:predicted Zn-dependent peptidase